MLLRPPSTPSLRSAVCRFVGLLACRSLQKSLLGRGKLPWNRAGQCGGVCTRTLGGGGDAVGGGRRAGICAGPVPVALSRPGLSPHPLPFQCSERGVAAFAGEMADTGGGGEARVRKVGNV